MVKATHNNSSVRIRLDINQIERRGDLLDLTAHLTNLSQSASQDPEWQVGNYFSGSYRKDITNTQGGFSGVVLTDRARKKRYLVAADSATECVCTVNLSYAFLDAGQTIELEATYAAPPTSTTKLDATIPTIGTIRDLPIS